MNLGLRHAIKRVYKAPFAALPDALSLRLQFFMRLGRLPDLHAPRDFTELVQARKLTDRDPRLPRMADKIEVKRHVADVLGEPWVIPTLWFGTELPAVPPWPKPFVVKSSHASRQTAFVRSEQDNWNEIRRQAARWLRTSYGRPEKEWLYAEIPPRLLVEPFIGSGVISPPDFKIFVFGGMAAFIEVDTDRECGHKRTFFDRDWQRLNLSVGYPTDPRHIARPARLAEMLDAGERLGGDFDFVRVDFYEVGGRPLFGELTFYPDSGFQRFAPSEWDTRFGDLWRRSRSRMRAHAGQT